MFARKDHSEEAVSAMLAACPSDKQRGIKLYKIALARDIGNDKDKASELYTRTIEYLSPLDQDWHVARFLARSKLGLRLLEVRQLIASNNVGSAQAKLDQIKADYAGREHCQPLQFGNVYRDLVKAAPDSAESLLTWVEVNFWGLSEADKAELLKFRVNVYARMKDYDKALNYLEQMEVVENGRGGGRDWPPYYFAFYKAQWGKVVGRSNWMNHLDEFFATFEATDNFHFAPLMAKKAKAMTFRLMDDALQSGDWDDVVKYGEYLLSLYPEMHKPTSVLYNVGLAYEKLLEVEASAKYYLRFLIRAPRSDVRLAGVREKLLKWKSGVARSLQEAIVGGCYEWECEPWDSSCACYVNGWRPCVGEHFAEMKNCFGDCKKKCAMDDKYEEDCYVDDCGFDNCEQSRYACNDPNTPPLTTWTMVCIGIWNPTMKWWDCICDRDYLTLVSCVNPNDEWCLCEAWLD